MPFKFRFEVLLKMRKDEEKKAQMDLGMKKQEKARLEGLLKDIKQAQADWGVNYNQVSQQTGQEDQLVLIENYLSHLDLKQSEVIKLIGIKEEDIQNQMRVIEKAYQARRQIEILKEKQKEEYDAQERKTNLNFMEELGLLKYNHTKIEERRENE